MFKGVPKNYFILNFILLEKFKTFFVNFSKLLLPARESLSLLLYQERELFFIKLIFSFNQKIRETIHYLQQLILFLDSS